jgi:eukaryotic-like serine/threonine-protein kinase
MTDRKDAQGTFDMRKPGEAHTADGDINKPPALQQLQVLPPGTPVGGYVLGALRARGGFASVYHASSLSDRKPAAVKVLHPHLSTATKQLRRFQAEVQIVNLLEHPNIVVVHEAGELAPGRPYFVMEWLDGRNLAEEIRARGPLSVTEVLPIFEQLVDGLTAAHQDGIIHRDLKSSNVMLVPRGGRHEIKLVDFGVAKLVDPDHAVATQTSGLTSTNVAIGTPLYMAPEQFRCQPVDARTDIYALGVVLFEALVGRVPFHGDEMTVRDLHLHAKPPLAREFAPVAAAVDAVIQKCLDKDPQKRFATAREVVAALREASQGAVVVATRPPAAIGLCIELEIACDDDTIDGELFDHVESRLQRCIDTCTSAGLEIALHSTNLVLATAPLPESEDEGCARREQVMRAALALGEELWRGPDVDTRIRAKVSLHVAEGAPGDSPVTGELMALERWTAKHPGDAVLATPMAYEGLEDRFATTQVDPADERLRILGAV